MAPREILILTPMAKLYAGRRSRAIADRTRDAHSIVPRGTPELAPRPPAYSPSERPREAPASWVSDRLGKFGRSITTVSFFAVQGALLCAEAMPWALTVELFFPVAALLSFAYGSVLAFYLVATSDLFGIRYLSENYSYVFTEWGMSGLLFPSVGGYVADLTGDYELALVPSGALSIVGALMCLYLKKRLVLYL